MASANGGAGDWRGRGRSLTGGPSRLRGRSGLAGWIGLAGPAREGNKDFDYFEKNF
jgi:hypothetical protein